MGVISRLGGVAAAGLLVVGPPRGAWAVTVEEYIDSLDYAVYIAHPVAPIGQKQGIWDGCGDPDRLSKTILADGELAIAPVEGATKSIRARLAEAGINIPVPTKEDQRRLLGSVVFEEIDDDAAELETYLDYELDRLDLAAAAQEREFRKYVGDVYGGFMAQRRESRLLERAVPRGGRGSLLGAGRNPSANHIEDVIDAMKHTAVKLLTDSPYAEELRIVLEAVGEAKEMSPPNEFLDTDDVARDLASERLAKARRARQQSETPAQELAETEPSPTTTPLPDPTVEKNLLMMLPSTMVAFLTSAALGELLNALVVFKNDGVMRTALDGGIGQALERAADQSLARDDYSREMTCGIVSLLAGACTPGEKYVPPSCPAEETELPAEVWLKPSDCDLLTQPPVEGKPVRMQLQSLGSTGSSAENGYVVSGKALGRDGDMMFYVYRAVAQWGELSLLQLCRVWFPKMGELLPGWKTVAQFWSAQEGNNEQVNEDTLPAFPLTSVLEGEPCHFFMINRGTTAATEALSDYDAIQVPLEMEGHPEIKGMAAHRGAYNLVYSMWPAFNDWMHNDVLKRCKTVDFFVGGHSLGGGLTTLWTVKIQDRYGDVLAQPVQAVSLAPMHSINEVAAQFLLDQKVNIRHVMFEADPIPYLPLANENGLPLCDERRATGVPGQGRVKPYPQHIHRTIITREGLANRVPLQTKHFWTGVNFLKIKSVLTMEIQMGKPMMISVGQAHWCAYGCAFNQYCTNDVSKQALCEVSYATADAPFTECADDEKEDTEWPTLSCHRSVTSGPYCYA